MRSCTHFVVPLFVSAVSLVLFACIEKEDTFDPDDFNTSSSSSSSGSSRTSSGSSSGNSSSGSTTSGAGSISIRYTAPSDCLTELPISNLQDDNDAVAQPAQIDVEYDGAEPGTYHGTFDLGASSHGVFTYTLAAPPDGMHRQYRMNLLRFDQKLNHCVNSSPESDALKYTDVPEGGATTSGPIYLTLAVTSPCAVKDIKTSIPGVSTAAVGGTYGPIPAGTWNGSFYWYDGVGNNASGPNATTDFGFTVKAPPAGTKRTVRITLVDYSDKLSHCVFGASSPVFDDQPVP